MADLTITRGARLAVTGLLVLTLITGGGNLWATYAEVHAGQAAQRHAGQVTERKLCTTLGRLAALEPPPGGAAQNPSRAYEQQLHATLAELGPDIGCN